MTPYDSRYKILDSHFQLGANCRLPDAPVQILFFKFESPSATGFNTASAKGRSKRTGFGPLGRDSDAESSVEGRAPAKEERLPDHEIRENFSFEYPVFIPAAGKTFKFEECILLLHGLNERSWSKYLPWAESLCMDTGKPVILFPIAFHMNRAPNDWSNPRSLVNLLNIRRDQYDGDRSISYANIALSARISKHPERFYLSGRQTWADLTALFEGIKTGRHRLFKEGTDIDIFAYSIGALLSQVALMANRKGLFSDARLFMFCGGSIFRSMQGISRSILDKPAFEQLQHYYVHVFGNENQVLSQSNEKTTPFWKRDNAFNAFLKMITPERFRLEREKFFNGLGDRIRGIALAKDTVIPYHGIEEALGLETSRGTIQLLDFPFDYTHETPFPINTKDTFSLNRAFRDIFSRAADFLG